MALRSLESDYPIIDSNFQNFCASHGIFSVEDFLLHDLDALASLAEKQPSSRRLKEGITQVLSLIDSQHQPWLNGIELLEDAHRNKHVLSTGCEGIDLLLEGGLRKGQLTELVGPSSSGKSQVCLQAASIVAMKHVGIVIYFDTGNSFSPQRVAHCVSQSSNTSLVQARREHLQKVMSRILCHSVFDIFALLDVLRDKFNSKSQMHGTSHQVQLLIIDSISSLITPILGGSQGRALTTSAGVLLKKLAHEHNLAVLVTNHTVGGDGGISKPALGESWKSIPHVRLQLSRDHGSNGCSVTILRHSSMASGASRFMVFD